MAAALVVAAAGLAVAACNGVAGGHPATPGGGAGMVQMAPVPDYPPVAVRDLLNAAGSLREVPARAEPALDRAVTDDDLGLLARRGCLPVYTTVSVDPGNCVFGDRSGRRTMVVLGDTHAAMWLPALDAIGQRTGWRVIDLNKVSCPPAEVDVYLNQQSRPYTECRKWMDWARPEIATLRPDLLLVTGETGYRVLDGSLQAGLTATLESVARPGMREVVLGDTAYLTQDAPDCLTVHLDDPGSCSTPRYEAVNEAGRRAEMAAAEAAGAAFVDPIPWLCTDTCPALVGDMVVYEDEQDLSRTYVEFLSGALQSALLPEMGAAGRVAPGGGPGPAAT